MTSEMHFASRAGWLRAAVLGANDGLLSTASLVLGVASAHATHASVLVAGSAGLIAGAMSMAAGEYVSVSSQADSETADLAREADELSADPVAETRELAAIYVSRGLDAPLARQVATALMAHDALSAHARDELGFSDATAARPLQAAAASAISFATGAIVPLVTAILVPSSVVLPVVALTAMLFLALLGALGARAGGAPLFTAALRVTFWGAVAMLVTAGLGHLVGTVV